MEDVVRKKEKDGEKEKDLRSILQSKKSQDRERKELEAGLERERKQREHESDGDWHCGDHHCRYINFKKNSVCKMCSKPPPETPVFWDITDPDKPKKKKKSKKESKSKRDSSQDSGNDVKGNKMDDEPAKDEATGSRTQVTSFLDDIGDSFDDEISKHLSKCSSSPVKSTNDEVEGPRNELPEVKQEEFKSPLMNDSFKLEDVSSQDLNFSQDNSIGTLDNSISPVKKEQLEPKYSWKDRSNTSGEFELTLEINDPEFLDTVKNEYRSSSPSWSNTKFKFPMKEIKTESKVKGSLPNLPEPEDNSKSERSVSVRKRMEDQMKKETDSTEKVEDGKLSDEKAPVKKESEMEKIKIDTRHKDRTNYRSGYEKSSTDSSSRAGHDTSPRRRKVEEDRNSEKRKKDERQRERDRKDRERNDKKREDDERQRRSTRRRYFSLINTFYINHFHLRKEQLEEEKRKLDEEKKEISRKRQEERRIMESRKRSRSKSEDADKPRKKEKVAAIGDLRKRLDDMKKSPEKKVKKRESSTTSSSSSSSDTESEQDVVQKIFEDKKLLKKMLQLASASKKKNKKKGKKKKKSSKDKVESEKPLERRVVLSGRDGLTMQLSTSQEERSPSPVSKKKYKRTRAPSSGGETLEIKIKNNSNDRNETKKAFDSPSPSPPRTR